MSNRTFYIEIFNTFVVFLPLVALSCDKADLAFQALALICAVQAVNLISYIFDKYNGGRS